MSQSLNLKLKGRHWTWVTIPSLFYTDFHYLTTSLHQGIPWIEGKILEPKELHHEN